MLDWQGTARGTTRRRIALNLVTGTAILAATAGCSKLTDRLGGSSQGTPITYGKKAERPKTELKNPLHRATKYWAEQHQQNPKDATAALSYARNLKALGSKGKAMTVLARAHQYHPRNGEIASEYGRLALDTGDERLAAKMLDMAEKAGQGSDWRLLSAKGTLQAKRGDHATAQRYYRAALERKPDSTSVINNLSLSYALDGKAGEAETLLKQAVDSGRDSARIRKNLALVLGLQGKFSEAERYGGADMSEQKVASNMKSLQSLVDEPEAAGSPPARAVAGLPATQTGATRTASLPRAAPDPAAPEREDGGARAPDTARTAQGAPPPLKRPQPPRRQTAESNSGQTPDAALPASLAAPSRQAAQPAHAARSADEAANGTEWSTTVAEAQSAASGKQ